MLDGILNAVYDMSVPALVISTVLVLAASSVLHIFLKPIIKQTVGIILTVCVLLLLLYVTILGRSEPETGLLLIPGNSIGRISESEVYLKMVLMNVFIFVPYGAFMTLAIHRAGIKLTVLLTLLSGLFLTILIELLQYALGLGCAETDDMICNVAGVVIGLIPYLVIYTAFSERVSE